MWNCGEIFAMLSQKRHYNVHNGRYMITNYSHLKLPVLRIQGCKGQVYKELYSDSRILDYFYFFISKLSLLWLHYKKKTGCRYSISKLNLVTL